MVEQAVGQLIGLGNPLYVIHIGIGPDALFIQAGGISHQADDRIVRTGDDADPDALAFKASHQFFQFFFGGSQFGADNHMFESFR